MKLEIGDRVWSKDWTIEILKVNKDSDSFRVCYKFIGEENNTVYNDGRLHFNRFKTREYKILSKRKEPINEIEVLDCFKDNESRQYE